MGVSVAFAAVFSLSVVSSVLLLAWYSVRQARKSGGKTWIELHAAGIVHFTFGTEINPSQGDRSAIGEEQSTIADKPGNSAPSA